MRVKKTILVALNSLYCGGIEKSALALLSRLIAEGNEVTLAMCCKAGDLLPFVPREVAVVEIPYSADMRYEMTYGRKRALLRYLAHLRLPSFFGLLRFWRKIFLLNADQRFLAIMQRYCRSIRETNERYDIAYCFSEFMELVYVADCVNAERKAIWLHTEQGNGFSDVREYAAYLRKMDEIYCVSDALKESVEKALPELATRIKRYHHIVDFPSIRAMGNAYQAEWPAEDGRLRVLSVGRLAHQKGFDIAISVARRLKDEGLKFSWIILGEGTEHGTLQAMIDRLGVGDCVSLIGVRTNPYPFFRECDIYVQPSRYEGYCLTIAEARAFCKPIVATDFNGAREQLDDGRLGLVVPCEEESILCAVRALLTGESLRRQLSECFR